MKTIEEYKFEHYASDLGNEVKYGSKQVRLGTIHVGGNLYVSDPCYKHDIKTPTGERLTVNITDVLPGIYHAYKGMSDEGEWGNHVAYLMLLHEDIKKILDEYGLANSYLHAAVDSGQLGIFNEERFKEQDSDPQKHGEFYDECGRITLPSNGGRIYRPYGIVSSSGYGDGWYGVRIIRSVENNKACGVVAEFIVDEYEEEAEDGNHD